MLDMKRPPKQCEAMMCFSGRFDDGCATSELFFLRLLALAVMDGMAAAAAPHSEASAAASAVAERAI